MIRRPSCVFVALIGLTCAIAAAQDLSPIKLPAPQLDGGKPLMPALKARQSAREYSSERLSPQVLSNLLWAAWGINRQDGRHTAPSASNKQEIDVYVTLPDGAYLYDGKAHVLNPVASLNLAYVADVSKVARPATDPQQAMNIGADAGYISANAYLFCAPGGLATVVRASLDKPVLAKALKLRDTQLIAGGYNGLRVPTIARGTISNAPPPGEGLPSITTHLGVHALECRRRTGLEDWRGWPSDYLMARSSSAWRQSCGARRGSTVSAPTGSASTTSATPSRRCVTPRPSSAGTSRSCPRGRTLPSRHRSASNRAASDGEREEPACLVVVTPSRSSDGRFRERVELIRGGGGGAWLGAANRLSPAHEHEWPTLDDVARAATQNRCAGVGVLGSDARSRGRRGAGNRPQRQRPPGDPLAPKRRRLRHRGAVAALS